MAMQDWKSVYSRIFWKNKREGGTPLNEANLNTSDIALKEIDNRILELRDAKFGKAEANVLIKDWNIDEKTGIITVTWLNNTTKVYDLNIEKIPVSFVMSNDGIITMTTADGTEFKTDLKKAIPIYTFKGSATIKVTPSIGESGDKVYTFDIVDGSIDGTKLNPDYLAQINSSVGNASNYAESAQTSANKAQSYANQAQESAKEAEEYVSKVGDTILNSTATTHELSTSEGGIRVNEILGCTHKSPNLLKPTLETTTVNGVTITNNGDGTYTLNGTSTKWGITNLNYIDKNTKSIPVGKWRLVGGKSTAVLEVIASSRSIGSDAGYRNGIDFEIKNSDTNSWARIRFDSGVTFDNVIVKPMVTEDLTATYDDYEPYGITSSGDGGGIEVKEVGKNLWDEQWEVGGLNAYGTNGTETDRIRCKNYISVKPNTSYYSTYNNIVVFYYDSSKAFISSFSTNGTINVFTTPANTAYIRFRCGTPYGTSYKNDIAIMEGETATYEPYQENTASIPLTEPLRGIGDVTDEITKDGIVRRIGTREYTSGDETDDTVITDNTTTYYVLPTQTTEPITTEQKIALNSLVSFKDKTYIDTADKYAKATLDIDYSNSDAGALALQNENELGKLKQAIIELGGTISI